HTHYAASNRGDWFRNSPARGDCAHRLFRSSTQPSRIIFVTLVNTSQSRFKPTKVGHMAITRYLSPKPRVLVVGGGYAGYNVAKRLQKKIRDRGGIVTVVEPNSYLTYQPFLPEVVGGSIEPRHAVVDLRSHLRQSEIVQGKIVEIQHAQKTAIIEGPEGATFELPYQDVVVTAGADSRVFPIEGLGEAGIGLKRIEEAVYLHNQILERIESAALMTDADQRRQALTF